MELHPNYPLVTERLSLRPLVVDDVDELLAYRSRADVCRYLPFQPMTREVMLARLRTDMSRGELTDDGQALFLGVRLRGDAGVRSPNQPHGAQPTGTESDEAGRLVGDVVLFWRSREHGGAELGYVFAPDAGGFGYATEACTAVLGLAFDQLALHRVVARLDARNDRSARLAERLGMRREAHLISNELLKGEWTDELDYAILAEEWSAMAR